MLTDVLLTNILMALKEAKTRRCDNCITPFYDIISKLLDSDSQQIFYYKSVLWHYLVDNHEYEGSYVNFVCI